MRNTPNFFPIMNIRKHFACLASPSVVTSGQEWIITPDNMFYAIYSSGLLAARVFFYIPSSSCHVRHWYLKYFENIMEWKTIYGALWLIYIFVCFNHDSAPSTTHAKLRCSSPKGNQNSQSKQQTDPRNHQERPTITMLLLRSHDMFKHYGVRLNQIKIYYWIFSSKDLCIKIILTIWKN